MCTSLWLGIADSNCVKCEFWFQIDVDLWWAFLPISTMHIIVIQLLATIPSQFVDSLATADVASIFWLMPMSKWDCDEVIGMTKSFYDALPKLPDIVEASCPDVVCILLGIYDFAVFDLWTLDPIVKQGIVESILHINHHGTSVSWTSLF